MTMTSRSPTRCTSTAGDHRPPVALRAPTPRARAVVFGLVLAALVATACDRAPERAGPEPEAPPPEQALVDAPDAPLTATQALQREVDAARDATHPGTLEVLAHEVLPFGGETLVHARLDNGLELFVVEDHGAAVIGYQTWFRAGSRHDPSGLEGLAHVLEHLMFRRTESREDGEFDREMERFGINPSAYTWLDYTYYFQTIPAAQLAHVAEIEADRMANLHIDAELVEAERQVVLSERHYRVDNDPVGAMLEVLYQRAFGNHPYRHQPVGTRRGLERLTAEDCALFYRAYYHPGNAAVIVVGDVETVGALETLRVAYGALEGRARRTLPTDEDAPWPEARSQEVLEMPIEAELFVLGFPAPPVTDADNLVLRVLDTALFDEPWGRLHRELQLERELVTRVGGWVGEFRFRSLYEISVAMRPGIDHEEARLRILTTLASLATEPLPGRTVARAHDHLELELLERLQSVEGRAEAIGHAWVTADEPMAPFRTIERVRAVTPEAIQRVAARLFAPEHLSEVLGRRRGHGDDDGEDETTAQESP